MTDDDTVGPDAILVEDLLELRLLTADDKGQSRCHEAHPPVAGPDPSAQSGDHRKRKVVRSSRGDDSYWERSGLGSSCDDLGWVLEPRARYRISGSGPLACRRRGSAGGCALPFCEVAL
jgi:hypothetical protein